MLQNVTHATKLGQNYPGQLCRGLYNTNSDVWQGNVPNAAGTERCAATAPVPVLHKATVWLLPPTPAGVLGVSWHQQVQCA
jgi:hypothetical protein